MECNSVCAHAHGLATLLCVQTPVGFDKSHLSEFQKALEHVVMKDMKNNKVNFQEAILNVEMIRKQSIHFYRGEDKQDFIKIIVVLSSLNAACSLLEGEIIIPSINFQDCRSFESNINFDICFMIETKDVGCS